MKKKLLYLFLGGLILTSVGACWLWSQCFRSNTGSWSKGQDIVFIPEGMDMDGLTALLTTKTMIRDPDSFRFTARLKKFTQVKPGRYKFIRGMNNQSIVNMLRSGRQEPVLVPVGSLMRTFPQLAGDLSHYLEPDSIQFLNCFNDPTLADSLGFNSENFRAMFLANSYSMNWNTSPRDFVSRMLREYQKFWNDENRSLAGDLGLSDEEVVILASIVKGETRHATEAPRIAGLYLNRLKIGMKLQSDPTVEFAMGREDQRLRNGDLTNTRSPYNTYQIAGLPPGPVFFTESSYLNAVLHAEKHNYIYMCAKADGSGYHAFTRSGEEHAENAAAYHRYLDRQGLR